MTVSQARRGGPKLRRDSTLAALVVFRIKICGLRTVQDAEAAVAAGADAIGLNFYRGSKRCVDQAAARRIADAVRHRAAVVGLFVNHAPEEIAAVHAAVACDWIQLHGDESANFAERLSGVIDPPPKILRAVRVKTEDQGRLADRVEAACDPASPPDAVLLDPHTSGYGGSGTALDWTAAARERSGLGGRPLVLAGGLTPENVAEAIQLVRPDAVDVASGVESSPGVKDVVRMRAFCQAAGDAFSGG